MARGIAEIFFFNAAIDVHQKVTIPPFRACFTARPLHFTLLAHHHLFHFEAATMKLLSVISATVLVGAGVALAATDAAVPYPQGYRQWQHIKSMVIQKGHPLFESFGGIHHLYANDKAMQGYRNGKFPDGAVIVFDLLEANAADASVTEGKRKVVGVMHRDATKYAATGGWGFEGFAGDSSTQRAVGDQATTACFTCHIAQKQHDYVFSSYRP
jgi:hypothetical protein